MILEDFYYGKLRPNELTKPSNPELQKIDQKIIDSLQMLKERLSAKDFDQVEKLFDLQSDSNSLHSALSFIQGYKIGALMMIDVFSGEKDSISEGM
ncbi:hypothetical protein HQN87_12300 [Paenibacillus tritici]|uniref:Uncharacterized protein n=1 Tax=Paenibacillus tritici TaxID=1873425 RepID=A0ABX2DPS9_9BACL|nr:DUF6809 family protein [Paenibacillus tritici]NQX46114.1 hypothetical protein [Paenibacillus tritici]QUL58299.1 hypothetical protein KDC22_19845 [Paenibacillus tritici]